MKSKEIKKGVREREIVIPILNDEYKVIVCWGDSDYIRKVLKAWWYPNDFDNGWMIDRRGLCFHSDKCHPVIALPKQPKTGFII
jgi:hypothetical protein